MASRDYEEFIAALNARGVRYLIEGAHAVAFHARPRATGDLDVLVDPTSRNARKLLAAVRDLFPASRALKLLGRIAPRHDSGPSPRISLASASWLRPSRRPAGRRTWRIYGLSSVFRTGSEERRGPAGGAARNRGAEPSPARAERVSALRATLPGCLLAATELDDGLGRGDGRLRLTARPGRMRRAD